MGTTLGHQRTCPVLGKGKFPPGKEMPKPQPHTPSLEGHLGSGVRHIVGLLDEIIPRLLSRQFTSAAKSPPLLRAPSGSSPSPLCHHGVTFPTSPGPGFTLGEKIPTSGAGKALAFPISTAKDRGRGEAALVCLANPPPSSFWALLKCACFNLSACLTGEMDWKTPGGSKQLAPQGKLSAHNSLGLV